MNEIFEKIYNDNNTGLNEDIALFEKVYTEAEMLNEMNPKLRALLAAGLIGTASLGAASCSMPTDDPTGYEQPAPETTNPDNPNPDDSGDNNGGGEEENGEETVTFETLGVSDEDAESLARARKSKSKGITITTSKIVDGDYNEFRYLNKEYGFILVEFKNNQYEDGQTYIRYRDGNTHYYVPENMESDFDSAIAAYKATYAE